MKALIALTVLAASALPAAAASDPSSPMEALSTSICRPAIIGTVVSVHTDPTYFGTDVVLDSNGVGFIAMDHEKYFPTIGSYVGQKVVIWGSIARNYYGVTRGVEMTGSAQLMLLSTALAEPKKTNCFASRPD